MYWKPIVSAALWLFSCPVLAADTPAEDSTDDEPRWLREMRAEASAASGKLQNRDSIGHRLTRRAQVGIYATDLAVGVGATAFVLTGDYRFPAMVGSPVGVAGTIGSGIALERAVIDLNRRGVHVSPAAMRVGHVWAAAGTLSFAGGIIMMQVFDDQYEAAVGNLLFLVSPLPLAISTIPYAIELAHVRQAYSDLHEEEDRVSTLGLSVAPYVDPVDRTFGISGTF